MRVSMHLWLFCTMHVAVLLSDITCEIVDMSYNYANSAFSYHPALTNLRYKLAVVRTGPWGQAPWVAVNQFTTGEHMGTHIDAPYHFLKTGLHVDEIPLRKLYGPAVVIDITERAKNNPNAAVLKQDLERWEEKYGQIPDNAFILMNSGWGKYWADGPYGRYVGFKNDTENPLNMNFPGFSVEAIDWLLENRKSFLGIGVDSLSLDVGNDAKWLVHVKLLGAGKTGVENMARMEKLPNHGAKLYLFPMKIQDGTGAAARAYAAWGSDTGPFSPGVAIGVGAASRASLLTITGSFIVIISYML